MWKRIHYEARKSPLGHQSYRGSLFTLLSCFLSNKRIDQFKLSTTKENTFLLIRTVNTQIAGFPPEKYPVIEISYYDRK